ncbi:ABC transporter ATP-binding protein [Candidatus Poribacteria bacterium]|nr:MAG: ABC transporter ATP-binding protein [Candidatus Poribacteria bacterium]
MVKLENVGYQIGKQWLVRNINVTIENGALWGLVGPNGAGKSTLLRLISGELLPTTGEVRIFGKPIQSYPPKELARIRAYLQQKRDINFPFTSLEVALFGRHPYLNGTKETVDDVSIAKGALQRVEANMFEERLYPTLSGGEASRVDVARILTQAPDLFLLDEPTNHLDPRYQVRILNLCKTICSRGKTVITAIHDLNLASMCADQLLLLKDGVSVASGPPQTVLTLELLSEVYNIPFDVLPHPDGHLWVMPTVDLS